MEGQPPCRPPDQLPNSRKIYLAGERHPDIRVPFREISLALTKTMNGEMEVNEPVRVYDTSGPWGRRRSTHRSDRRPARLARQNGFAIALTSKRSRAEP